LKRNDRECGGQAAALVQRVISKSGGLAAALQTVLLLCAFKCGPAPAAPPPPVAQPGPRIVLPDGYAVQVEVAADDPMREQGLMYRDHLAEDRGMIFMFPRNSEYSFWMKNTLIPLDMIWIDEAKRVVHVSAVVPPCQADPCPSYPPGVQARYVLELAKGVAAKHGVINGSTLRFEGLDNVVIH
jgi:uncharacterized membrane protein (UPF0127 family)